MIKFHQDTIHSQILHVDDRQFFQFFQVFLTHIGCFTVAVYPSIKKVGNSTLATCFGSEYILTLAIKIPQHNERRIKPYFVQFQSLPIQSYPITPKHVVYCPIYLHERLMFMINMRINIGAWNPNDPCFDWSLDLLLQGSKPKTEDKQVPGTSTSIIGAMKGKTVSICTNIN